LGAVALLANVIFSPLILKERFHLSDLGGILLAIIGAVTVVFSSKQSDATLNPDELWHALCRKSFIAYVVISIALAALLAWGSTTVHGERWILLDVGVCAVLGE
jgi:drug/metabolite transporter (DMT)-like permease